ncbi:putative membrane protein YqiK [Amaricoccus macauensis]|uniref:Putative membrane protein YqiK n=1 Tax=Amaricoccus macauensis TaxID=57001 RepID=A0A840STM8_9RHOB|nr:putative membrane protein YqiK [Amaricoccus macauensis]
MLAEESVATNRKVAEAERQKRIAILAAEEEAEKEATRVRVEAKAEREAAADRSASIRAIAEAEAAQITIRAEATRTEKLAEAEGQTALIAAENALSPEIIELKLAIARLEALPKIIAEMVKPAEKIESIRINQVTGLGAGQGAGPLGAGTGAQGGLVDQAVGAIGAMALQHPVLKAIGESAGLTLGEGLNGILDRELGNTPASAGAQVIELPQADQTA